MIITHENLQKYLYRLLKEDEFSPGYKGKSDPDKWYRELVWLEFPTGEAARSGLQTLALIGKHNPEHVSIDGTEGFNAQGLEGKVRVRKELFSALMNMRDLLPKNRGRIITD